MSVYDQRPWLNQYPKGYPTDIEIEHQNALACSGRLRTDCLMRRRSSISIDRSHSENWMNSLMRLPSVCGSRASSRANRLAVYLQNVPQFSSPCSGRGRPAAIVGPGQPDARERGARDDPRRLGRKGAS